MAQQPTNRIPKLLETKDVAALVDLKGELLNKQLKRKKDASADLTQHLFIKTSKKNPLQLAKSEAKKQEEEGKLRGARIRELEQKVKEEEENLRLKSRLALEQKAAQYDRLSSGGGDDDSECMVDFTRKHREATHSRHDDDDDDDWVEYTDEFGRSRKCHREELPLNEARVALHSRSIKGDDESTRGTTSSAIVEPPSAITVHHVAEDDRRVYGVSHVRFAADETRRQEQMSELLQLTEKTREDRERSRKLTEKRAIDKLQRMNKVRVRKGLPPIVADDSSSSSTPLEEIPLPGSSPAPPVVDTKSAIVPKKSLVREWDRGKVTPAMVYVESRRQERDNEFAPPSSYF